MMKSVSEAVLHVCVYIYIYGAAASPMRMLSRRYNKDAMPFMQCKAKAL